MTGEQVYKHIEYTAIEAFKKHGKVTLTMPLTIEQTVELSKHLGAKAQFSIFGDGVDTAPIAILMNVGPIEVRILTRII